MWRITFRLVSSPKLPFRWRLPESNPYLRDEIRNTVTSRYNDVAMAVCHNRPDEYEQQCLTGS